MYPRIIILSLLLIAGFAAVSAQEPTSSATPPDSSAVMKDSTSVLAASSDKVVVYYFHGTRRCANCKKIEAYTREAIDSSFAADLKKGVLEFRELNTDDEGNGHFIEDYKLYTKSVVLSVVQNGKEVRWKNLEKVWEYLGNREGFLSYIADEVRAIRGEK